jgi:hypothetical protein
MKLINRNKVKCHHRVMRRRNAKRAPLLPPLNRTGIVGGLMR